MAARIALKLASAMLAGGPPPVAPDGDDGADSLSDAEAFSAVAGTILGAASACNAIERDRVVAAGQKVSALVLSSASDDDEIDSAWQLFADNLATGKAAVASGVSDCQRVEAALAALEALAQCEEVE